MQFDISMMFLGFPDKIHEEKPSFSDFENNWLRTDGRTDRPSYGDGSKNLEEEDRLLSRWDLWWRLEEEGKRTLSNQRH